MPEEVCRSGAPERTPPIAQLNSDYKIFTKILEGRLRILLPRLIDRAQVGFVPGRSIESALDNFAAVQRTAARDHELGSAIAILLGFAKAYDSLQRAFLLAALKWQGFSSQLVM